MKIALLGYGRMGKTIEEIALQRGHKIILKVDENTKEYDITNAEIQLSDEFDVTGGISEANQLKLDFSVKFIDEVGSVYTGAVGQTPASIGIYYTNAYSADTGSFTYSYTSSS